MKLEMAPTSEDLLNMMQQDPYEIFLSNKEMDNSCETYFYRTCSSSPPMRSSIPEASPVFRRALGTLGDQGNYSLYQSESDDDDNSSDGDNKPITMQRDSSKRNSPVSSTSSPVSYSSLSPSSSASSSPASSPKASTQLPRTRSRPINTPPIRRKTATTSPKNSSKFLSVPSSSLPTDSSTPCKRADISDSGAHTTLAGVALRKGCTRKAASFGGYDTVKVDGRRYEKRVSWADERGSKHQLIHVRLIRPRLATSTSDGTSSTPGHSILKTTDN